MKTKIKVKELTKLGRKVWKWAREQDKENPRAALEDVTRYGCQSGIVGELIYYTDTLKFYKKHQKEIDGLLSEMIDSSGLGINELFGDKWEKEDPLARDTMNKNLLAWFGFEETANNLLMQLEDEES